MNSNNRSTLFTDKWQRLSAIVNQHPTIAECSLATQSRKLFIYRLLAENSLVFLLQYIGLMFSTLTPHFSPIWFASGTACAFIFLRGYSILPGIGLGSFFAYYLSKATFLLSVSCAAVYTAQAFLLLYLSYRYISPTLIFYRRLLFIKFVVCASGITAFSSIALSLLCYSTLKFALSWWLANLNGVLIVAFALIAFDTYFPEMHALKKINQYKLVLLYGFLFFCTIGFLMSEQFFTIFLFSLLTLFFIVAISANFGWFGAISALFLVGFFATLMVYFNMTIFSIIFLQTVLIVETLVGFFTANRVFPVFVEVMY